MTATDSCYASMNFFRGRTEERVQSRMSALQMAIQYHAIGPSHVGIILETAKDFEKFLRGEHE